MMARKVLNRATQKHDEDEEGWGSIISPQKNELGDTVSK